MNSWFNGWVGALLVIGLKHRSRSKTLACTRCYLLIDKNVCKNVYKNVFISQCYPCFNQVICHQLVYAMTHVCTLFRGLCADKKKRCNRFVFQFPGYIYVKKNISSLICYLFVLKRTSLQGCANAAFCTDVRIWQMEMWIRFVRICCFESGAWL